MRANVKFNIVDEINHIALTHAFATLCGESLTSGNTGKWIGLNVKANMCEKCKEACRELITTLQACLPHEPSIGELGLISPTDDGSAVMDGKTRPKGIYR